MKPMVWLALKEAVHAKTIIVNPNSITSLTDEGYNHCMIHTTGDSVYVKGDPVEILQLIAEAKGEPNAAVATLGDFEEWDNL